VSREFREMNFFDELLAFTVLAGILQQYYIIIGCICSKYASRLKISRDLVSSTCSLVHIFFQTFLATYFNSYLILQLPFQVDQEKSFDLTFAFRFTLTDHANI